MQKQFVDVYTYMRDNAKPVTEQDAADLAKIRAPQPPSKAHLKRLARAGQGYVPEPHRLPERSSPARVRQDWAKAQLAQLGGTRTIASANGKPRGEEVFIYAAGASELSERAARAPRVALGSVDAKSGDIPKSSTDKDKSLKRDHMLAMGKMLYRDYQPDMFDVIDAFGSMEAYNKATTRV